MQNSSEDRDLIKLSKSSDIFHRSNNVKSCVGRLDTAHRKRKIMGSIGRREEKAHNSRDLYRTRCGCLAEAKGWIARSSVLLSRYF